MAKLSQLLTLECMLDAYDSLNIKDSWIIEKQGVCVVELVDDTNATLKRLISSKTRLSCRNVLVANFETMTNTAHWLKSKLFLDLPKALGKALREKIVQMVDLLKALMVKIIDVDEFAKEFFERLKKRYWKGRTTDYELWKARQSKLTIERLTEYQAELTANMLIMGVLKFDEAPSGQEMEDVDMQMLRKKLKDGKVLPDGFEIECAKLRRYSHWEGDRFVIDYHLLRKYLYCMFGKLTSDQHIKMFEYDIQMIQIHEDIERLGKKGVLSANIPSLPPKLRTEAAMALWQKAQAAGYVDANYQPLISRTQAALLADYMAERLDIKDKWKVFEELWNRKNMRSDYNEALEQRQTLEFRNKMKNIFR
jgi:hypothetical protein